MPSDPLYDNELAPGLVDDPLLAELLDHMAEPIGGPCEHGIPDLTPLPFMVTKPIRLLDRLLIRVCRWAIRRGDLHQLNDEHAIARDPAVGWRPLFSIRHGSTPVYRLVDPSKPGQVRIFLVTEDPG